MAPAREFAFKRHEKLPERLPEHSIALQGMDWDEAIDSCACSAAPHPAGFSGRPDYSY
jgi:hypothetical protein